MEVISAISTATGNAGIGIIRMSGKKCFDILDKIFIPKNKEKIEDIPGYSIKYGTIIDSETKEIIDEVLVSYFKEPKSYTTENMCEISSHGGIIIERAILEQCLKNGAKLAEPGEFTKKAFLNGRIDLIQAESVIDIINSKTDQEAKASINQLEGGLSNKIKKIMKKLLDLMATIEVSIDYPEYDIEETENLDLKKVLSECKEELIDLQKTFKNGKILKEGIKTIILGRPNAGKSSLLNNILKEDRAIVSEIEGTTRDTIEEFININGLPLKIIDTAGIRDTKDVVEEIGVKKALKLAEEADLVIAIFDISQSLKKEDLEILNIIKNKNAIIVLNKIDIKDKKLEKHDEIYKLDKPIVKISAKTGQGIEEIYNIIEKMFKFNEIRIENGTIITNVRHKNQIDKSVKMIKKAIESIDEGNTIDITAVNIKQTLIDLGNITGDNIADDILNEIFSKFCLGK